MKCSLNHWWKWKVTNMLSVIQSLLTHLFIKKGNPWPVQKGLFYTWLDQSAFNKWWSCSGISSFVSDFDKISEWFNNQAAEAVLTICYRDFTSSIEPGAMEASFVDCDAIYASTCLLEIKIPKSFSNFEPF